MRVVPFCDLTCPTQANPGGNLLELCECGGRRRELERSRLHLCRDGQLRTLQEIEERAAAQRERAKGAKVKGMRATLTILDEASDG